jgi:hypothetical protein
MTGQQCSQPTNTETPVIIGEFAISPGEGFARYLPYKEEVGRVAICTSPGLTGPRSLADKVDDTEIGGVRKNKGGIGNASRIVRSFEAIQAARYVPVRAFRSFKGGELPVCAFRLWADRSRALADMVANTRIGGWEKARWH